MRFPTRPSTRSLLASQPEAHRFRRSAGAAKSALSFLRRRGILDTTRNEASYVYENHEVGFHGGVAPGGLTAPHRDVPTIVGNRGMCVRPPGCHAGGWGAQVLLGRRICRDRRAFQSCRTCGAFQENVSLAGLVLSRGISTFLSCVKEATDTLDTVDNRSDARKRVTVGLQAWWSRPPLANPKGKARGSQIKCRLSLNLGQGGNCVGKKW